MKESFFSRIQTYFKANNHGRYLAFILAEIARQHPDIMSEALARALKTPKSSFKRLTLEPEYYYDGERRADLAVYTEGGSIPIALIEIKYHDSFMPGQMEAYCAWQNESKNTRKLLILSRACILDNRAPVITWTHFARILEKARKQSDLAKSLIEHLKEEGLVMQEVNSAALSGFLNRLLCPWNGAGNQAGNLEGPQEFGKLMRNLQLLSGRFNPHFKNAWKTSGTKHEESAGTKDATIDFDVTQFTKAKTLRKIEESNDIVNLDESTRGGGEVFVFARHALGSGKGWLRICYGLKIEIKVSQKETRKSPAVYFGTWANGQEFKDDEGFAHWKKLASFSKITTDAEKSIDQLEGIAAKQLLDILEKLQQKKNGLTARQRTATTTLMKTLGQSH